MAYKSRLLTSVFLIIFSICTNGWRASAQTVAGTILGTVRDAQGAVVPNASVTAKNLETGAERSVVTDGTGGYNIVSVPAGAYDISATAPGFRTELRSGVTLTVGADLRIDLTLSIGSVTEQVEVTGSAPLVDTTTSTMAGLVGDTTIRELPLNGRDWLELGLLQPGVDNVGSQDQNLSDGIHYGEGVKMTISGGRPSENVFLVDGLVINDQSNNSPGSALGVNMGVDAIREFSVLTNTYSAEYGRSAGGVVNAITKSGTNAFHGSAFEFIRNSALDARNFFDLPQIPPFRRNQFGGSQGGPIRKDKLFFFADYEGLRQFKSLSTVSETLSPNARNGILASGGKVAIDPRVQPYLSLFPQPNGPISGDTAQYLFGAGTPGSEDYVLGKIDYQLTSKTTLTGSYMFDNSSTTTPDAFDEKLELTRTRTQRVILSLQHVFTPTLLNTVRGGFNRVAAVGPIDISPFTPQLTNTAIGFAPGDNMGTIAVTGLSTIGGIGSSAFRTYWYTAPQFGDDLSWVKGRNSIRVGFWVESIRDNQAGPTNPYGGWAFNSVQQFLTVVPFSFSFDGFPGTSSYRGMREKVFGSYFQDDFRLRSNLTLNMGIRYEPATVVSEVNNLVANLHYMSEAQPVLGNPMYQNPTLRNFAPRVGVAWDPTGSGTTAVRAGFGIYDVVPLTNVFSTQIKRGYPYYESGVLSNPPASSFPSAASNLVLANSLQANYVEQNPHPAYKMQWNLNVQRQITNGMSVMAGYVGSRGIHLPLDADDGNMVPPSELKVGPGGNLYFPIPQAPKINPGYGRLHETEWGGYSYYHSLQVNVTEKFRKSLTFQGVYVWSKSIDDGSSEGAIAELLNAAQAEYPFNFNLDKSVSNFDTPQHFVMNLVWDAPSPHFDMAVARFLLSGWELSSIFTDQSGVPFTLGEAGDEALDGSAQGTLRPNFVPGPGCTTPQSAINPGNVNDYINMSCFSFTLPGQLGNLGRNTERGPSLQDFDFAILKNDSLFNERLRVQFRAEAFNLLNRANFIGQNSSIFNGSGVAQIQSGAALRTPTVTTSRQIQFGMKFIW